MENQQLDTDEIAMIAALSVQSLSAIALLHNELLRQAAPRPVQAKHVSILSGEAYTQEILSSVHKQRVLESLHMPLETFNSLCQRLREAFLLKDNQYTSVEHQVHIFLFIATTASSNQTAQERFQHSPESISRIFKDVIAALNHLSSDYICHPSANNADLSIVPPEILGNPKLEPFFTHCLRAIDGSLIPVKVPPSQAAVNRTRKGFTAQNVMVACEFDCTISYVLAGWEGSAHDSRVLADAYTKGFIIPKGKFYLSDAGYGISPECLTPYRGIRYHLKEQVIGDQVFVPLYFLFFILYI